jgi:integrase
VAPPHAADVAAVADTGQALGWSANWVRQVSRLALPVLCLAADKSLDGLDDGDFDTVAAALDDAVYLSHSAREHTLRRLFAVAEACCQLGVTARPRRRSGPVARPPAELAGDIRQPAIRRQVVRYAQTLATTLAAGSVYARVKALGVFCDWLADQHPTVSRLDQLDRTTHVEPFLGWDRTRPWRGANGVGRTISATQFHHDIVDLRCFFDDIACWGWPSQPHRRLLFASDIPRMSEPVPRALPPAIDRTVMAAIAELDDPAVRTGLQLLRATGMRLGELLDLELDCLVDFGRHGRWLRVPLGKLLTERMVPLDDDTVAVLDAWTALRGRQRALPHPRDGRPADFLFCQHGRRLAAHRLRRGLNQAVAAAGVYGPDGAPLRVTPHQLRHTYGTELVNGGISLPALMALLGHVTPEMTLRYAKLANPTIRAAYQAAIDKTRVGAALPIATINRTPVVADRVAWLRAEMLKIRLAHGTCTRDPTAGNCPYTNICEQCDNFAPAADAAPTLRAQLADIRALRDDAAGLHLSS